MDVTFECVRGPTSSRRDVEIRFSVPQGSKGVLLGREGADVIMDKDATTCCSRRHATLSTLDGKCLHLHDVGSSNGTFVNRVRVERATLHDGDEVVLGGGSTIAVGVRMTDEQYDHPQLVVWRVRFRDQSGRNKSKSVSNARRTPAGNKRERVLQVEEAQSQDEPSQKFPVQYQKALLAVMNGGGGKATETQQEPSQFDEEIFLPSQILGEEEPAEDDDNNNNTAFSHHRVAGYSEVMLASPVHPGAATVMTSNHIHPEDGGVEEEGGTGGAWFLPPLSLAGNGGGDALGHSHSVKPLDCNPDVFDEIMPRQVTGTRVGNFYTTKVKKLTFDPRSWRWIQESPNPHEKMEYTTLSFGIQDIVAIRHCSTSVDVCLIAVELSTPIQRVVATVFCPSRRDRSKYATVVFYFRKKIEVKKLVAELEENYEGIGDRMYALPEDEAMLYAGH